MQKIYISEVLTYKNRKNIIKCIEFALDENFNITKILNDISKYPLIVIKPNWVQEQHEYKDDVWEPVITNPTILLCLLECLAERISNRATICVCDGPHTYANFDAILERGKFHTQFQTLSAQYPNINFELLDLRREIWRRKEEVVVERLLNAEDPRGYVKVDLGKDSLFYDARVVNIHHHGKIQEYLLAGTPITCDLFINVPKMKTHKKTGITCCLKNLVGINGDKNWLPHHTGGSPDNNGDEYPHHSFSTRIESSAKQIGKNIALKIPVLGTWVYRKMRNAGKQILGDSNSVIRNGNWSGNDTCWRMALDLNRALLYVNPDGTWRDHFQPKAYLAVVDGIIGGEGNGPLCPDPLQSNVLVSGANPAEVDAVVAKLMGFDPRKIPIIANAFEDHTWPIATQALADIRVHDERIGKEISLFEVAPAVKGGFTPHFGWSNIKMS
jgi:hypothetical protein